MSRTNVPVLESVRAAFGFWRYSIPRTLGVLSAAMVANLASATMADAVVRGAFTLAGTLVGVMASGALLRLAFADEHAGDPEFRIGPGGFQWSRPETRLLGGLLLMLFLFGLGLLFLLVVVVVCSAVSVLTGGVAVTAKLAADPNSLPPNLRTTVGVLADTFALICIWVGVRVCLYPAATVAGKKLVVFSTWALTRGQFWRILACTVLVLLPTLVLTFVSISLNLPRALVVPLFLLVAVVNAFVELPLLFGLYAYLYRGLRPPGLAGPLASG